MIKSITSDEIEKLQKKFISKRVPKVELFRIYRIDPVLGKLYLSFRIFDPLNRNIIPFWTKTKPSSPNFDKWIIYYVQEVCPGYLEKWKFFIKKEDSSI